MPFALSPYDDEQAVAFIAKASPIICGAGIMPATLDLLDTVASQANAYADIAARTPGLAALAAEWVGPYAGHTPDDAVSPTTVRELVLAFLLGDETEDGLTYDFGFRTLATDDTEHWSLAGTPLEGVKVFGLYVIREGERTYICSMTPSSRADFLQNVFAYPDQSDEPSVNDYGQSAIEAYMDGEGSVLAYQNDESSGYFGYKGDRAELDKRAVSKGDVSDRTAFGESPLRVDLSKLDAFAGNPAAPDLDDAFADPQTLAAAFSKVASAEAWENAVEYFSGNQVEPRIIWQADGEPAAA